MQWEILKAYFSFSFLNKLCLNVDCLNKYLNKPCLHMLVLLINVHLLYNAPFLNAISAIFKQGTGYNNLHLRLLIKLFFTCRTSFHIINRQL